MKAARILVLGIALAAGGAAAYLVSGGEKRPEPAPPIVQRLPTVDVLIAKADIGMGTAISAQDLSWQAFELSPRQAETRAQSRQLGTLSLALRSLLDAGKIEAERDDRRKGEINTVRYGVSNTR